jgi:hypothetical protein
MVHRLLVEKNSRIQLTQVNKAVFLWRTHTLSV